MLDVPQEACEYEEGTERSVLFSLPWNSQGCRDFIYVFDSVCKFPVCQRDFELGIFLSNWEFHFLIEFFNAIIWE